MTAPGWRTWWRTTVSSRCQVYDGCVCGGTLDCFDAFLGRGFGVRVATATAHRYAPSVGLGFVAPGGIKRLARASEGDSGAHLRRYVMPGQFGSNPNDDGVTGTSTTGRGVS